MSDRTGSGDDASGAGVPAAVRASLDAERVEALEAVAAAERDFRRIVEASRSVSTDDEHDPEGAGLAVERALIVAFLQHARTRAGDLDRALERFASGGYGLCESCGEAIGAERLLARPAALTCIDCAGASDRGR